MNKFEVWAYVIQLILDDNHRKGNHEDFGINLAKCLIDNPLNGDDLGEVINLALSRLVFERAEVNLTPLLTARNFQGGRA